MRHVALAPIETAQRTVREERRLIVAERDAFEEFIERVQAVTATAPSASRMDGSAPLVGIAADRAEATGSALAAAYRDTVMSVSHYAEEYGEPLAEHLTAECGPDVASGMCADVPVTPSFKYAVLEEARSSRDDRKALLDALDTERDSLERSYRDLSTVVEETHATTSPSTTAAGHQFEGKTDLRETYGSVIEERQALIQRTVTIGWVTGHNLCEYLYQDAPWTYPVLRAAANLATDLEFLTPPE